jgi:hypothetical protein
MNLNVNYEDEEYKNRMKYKYMPNEINENNVFYKYNNLLQNKSDFINNSKENNNMNFSYIKKN